MVALSLILASSFLAGSQMTSDIFGFRRAQAVYVVAVKSLSRNLTVTSADLEVERHAKEQFKKEKAFRLAKVLSEADFVFLIVVDDASACPVKDTSSSR
jgi:2,3-bisphosphoglycerate-independent phosphoglycerate mutase